MSDVTRILSAIERGDPRAAEQLLPLVYDALRKLAAQKLAQEKPGQTLQATALVHEAYLRLVGQLAPGLPGVTFDSRGHFFAAAALFLALLLVVVLLGGGSAPSLPDVGCRYYARGWTLSQDRGGCSCVEKTGEACRVHLDTCRFFFFIALVARTRTPSPPAIKFPGEIDLGEREDGEIIVHDFQLANLGDGPLHNQDIRSDCSCAGIEVEQEGKHVRVDRLTIPPRSETACRFRIAVRGGQAEQPMHNIIQFSTNDGQHPECRIVASVSRVKCGVATAPKSLGFGVLRRGQSTSASVEVRDATVPPRRIERVGSSHPDIVKARFVPATEALDVDQSKPHPLGALVGHIQVHIIGRDLGDLEARVQIELAESDRQPDTLRVFGSVVPEFEINPPQLVLPRQTSAGPVYSCECVCWTRIPAAAVEVVVVEKPPGIRVAVAPSPEGGAMIVKVHCDPSMLEQPRDGTARMIRLRTMAGSQSAVLELPVLIRAPEER